MASVVPRVARRVRARAEARRQHFRLRDSPSSVLDSVLSLRAWFELSAANHLELRKRLRWIHQNSCRTLRAALVVFQRGEFHLPSDSRAIQEHGAAAPSDHQEWTRVEAAPGGQTRRRRLALSSSRGEALPR